MQATATEPLKCTREARGSHCQAGGIDGPEGHCLRGDDYDEPARKAQRTAKMDKDYLPPQDDDDDEPYVPTSPSYSPTAPRPTDDDDEAQFVQPHVYAAMGATAAPWDARGPSDTMYGAMLERYDKPLRTWREVEKNLRECKQHKQNYDDDVWDRERGGADEDYDYCASQIEVMEFMLSVRD